MAIWVSGVTSLFMVIILVPVVRKYSYRWKLIAFPRDDRWHRKATPKIGGVALFLAFIFGFSVGLLLFVNQYPQIYKLAGRGGLGTGFLSQYGFLIGSIAMFGIGLVDDFRRLSPPAKLVSQIVAASIVVMLGFTTNFFSARLDNLLIAQFLDILVTLLWLVVITNAINLLDNMDGLAGGIALITSLLLTFLFWRAGNMSLLLVSISLSGCLLGFLYFNFPPASIFMGDSGSLFLGFTLASLAIARQPQASNVFAILGVPTLLFLLPILDTILVFLTRVLRGQSPAQGGKDHTSHRLIAFGLTEKGTVLVLYFTAIIAGITAVAIEAIGYWLSLIIVPFVVATLAIATAYLGGLRVSSPLQDDLQPTGLTDGFRSGTNSVYLPLVKVFLELTYRRRFFEILLDFIIIVLALYLAFITRHGLFLSEIRLQYFLDALPITLVGTFIPFFYFGVYRGVWRYVGVNDAIRYLKAAIGSIVLVSAAVWFSASLQDKSDTYLLVAYSPVLFILYGIYLFLGLITSRSSFKILETFSLQQPRKVEQRIIIYGAGDAGEMALRWIQMNPELQYRPIGFIDDDPLKMGRTIHGIQVLGGYDQFRTLLEARQLDGVILALSANPDTITKENLNISDEENKHGLYYQQEMYSGNIHVKITSICRQYQCWVRMLRLGFDLVEEHDGR